MTIIWHDDGAPASRRMTIADYAARPLPPNEAPEWVPIVRHREGQWFSRTAVCIDCDAAIHERPGEHMHFYRGDHGPMCIDCADAHRLPPQGPMVPPTLRNRVVHDDTHKADPVWDVQFSSKFTREHKRPPVDAPLTLPKGSVKPLHEFIGRVEREQEVAYMAATCCCAYHAKPTKDGEPHMPEHRGDVHDIATTLAVFRANAIDAADLSEDSAIQLAAAEHASHHARITPLAVRLPDEVMPDPETGEPVSVPRYGGVKYIAAMTRLIEWEKWSDACSGVLHVGWKAQADGTVGLAPRGEGDDDTIRAVAKRVRDYWQDTYGGLPEASAIAVHKQRIRGRKASEMLTPDQSRAFESSRLYGDEDPDPGRTAFHAEDDPEPRRGEFPYGDCRNCTLDHAGPDRHRACTELGDALFREFKDRWDARQLAKNEVGYGGPGGMLGLDVDSMRGIEWDDPAE